jgi:hypothetical protein
MPSVVAFLTIPAAKIAAFGGFCKARRAKPIVQRRRAKVIVKASALRWLRGDAPVMRFDLPQARSFATAFCKTCGSPMPHLTRSGREAIVPAGSFDEPLGVTPDRHVHWASRADRYVHGDGLRVEE